MRALVMLVLMTLVWGTNWPLFPLAIQEVSVWTFRSIALPVAGSVLLIIAAMRGMSLRIPKAHWTTLVAVAVAYMVTWNICSTLSASMIPSGQSAVLGFTMPLWVALFAWPILGEKITLRRLLAIALGVTSVIMLMVPSLSAYAQAPLGLALGLMCGLGWAVGTIILKRRPIPVPPLVMVGWIVLLTSIPFWAITLVVADGQWFMPSKQTILVIAYISLIPMCIGNVCWFSIADMLPANLAALSTVMVPVVAMISGAIVHGEPLGALQLGAMFCSATALALVLIRPTDKRNPAS